MSLNTNIITNPNHWWFTKIYPFIPDSQKKYYLKPFGGTSVPNQLNSGFQDLPSTVNVVEDNNLQFKVTKVNIKKGLRFPICFHSYGTVVTVNKGYLTLFVEGCAPQTYGPGQSYYKPGGRVLTQAATPQPFIPGKMVRQDELIRFTDINAIPNNTRPFIWIENTPNGINWTKQQPKIESGKPYNKCGKECCKNK